MPVRWMEDQKLCSVGILNFKVKKKNLEQSIQSVTTVLLQYWSSFKYLWKRKVKSQLLQSR